MSEMQAIEEAFIRTMRVNFADNMAVFQNYLVGMATEEWKKKEQTERMQETCYAMVSLGRAQAYQAISESLGISVTEDEADEVDEDASESH